MKKLKVAYYLGLAVHRNTVVAMMLAGIAGVVLGYWLHNNK